MGAPVHTHWSPFNSIVNCRVEFSRLASYLSSYMYLYSCCHVNVVRKENKSSNLARWLTLPTSALPRLITFTRSDFLFSRLFCTFVSMLLIFSYVKYCCLFVIYVVDDGCEAGIPLKLDLYSTPSLNWLADIYSILNNLVYNCISRASLWIWINIRQAILDEWDMYLMG